MSLNFKPLRLDDLPYLGDTERAFGVMREVEVFEHAPLRTDDGVTLRVLNAGPADSPVVLLVNALGVSSVFLTRLAQLLTPRWRVLSWESRGLPNPDDATIDVSLERQAADMAAVVAAAGVRPEAVVSFCSGSNVAAWALAKGVLSARAWCTLSPSISTGEGAVTTYQRTMLPLWRQVAEKGPRYAALVRALIVKQGAPADGLQGTARELLHMNNLPFATPESTHRYAQIQSACQQADWPALLPRIEAATLVLHGTADDVIHQDTSLGVAGCVPGAQSRLIEGAGHFAVHDSPALHQHVAAFLQDTLAASPTPSGA